MKIVVIFPTLTESQHFSYPQVQVEIGGVGLAAAAYCTATAIARHQPDWLIIAGVYEHSRFAVGDVVLVESECESDLGFFTPTGFTHLADLDIEMDFSVTKTWNCPYLPDNSPLPLARSNSMNAAMAPFINTQDADIENMEGAAFYRVCTAEQQPFLQVRSISNLVKIGNDDWDMEGSILALTAGLHQIIDVLLARVESCE
jgi:nucleoside phosphorylase